MRKVAGPSFIAVTSHACSTRNIFACKKLNIHRNRWAEREWAEKERRTYTFLMVAFCVDITTCTSKDFESMFFSAAINLTRRAALLGSDMPPLSSSSWLRCSSIPGVVDFYSFGEGRRGKRGYCCVLVNLLLCLRGRSKLQVDSMSRGGGWGGQEALLLLCWINVLPGPPPTPHHDTNDAF